MALYRIKDFDPNYRDHFGDQDISNYEVYSRDEKVGSVKDLLVDDSGRIRYFVVNTGSWVPGKDILLPIGRARIEHRGQRAMQQGRVYVDELTREQVERLPRYDSETTVNHDHEERTRAIYRSAAMPSVETSVAVEDTPPVEADSTIVYQKAVRDRQPVRQPQPRPQQEQKVYRYEEHDPDLYRLNESDHPNIRLYEERLVASKSRRKVGEVAIGKHVETETAQVSVPVEKERIVVERRTPSGTQAVKPGQEAFREGEVARAEVYEERADIHKETGVREEVSVHKEIDRDTVEARDTIRRERLDIDVEGENRTVREERTRDRR